MSGNSGIRILRAIEGEGNAQQTEDFEVSDGKVKSDRGLTV